jgi:predicted ArsR family transcriptional regulator
MHNNPNFYPNTPSPGRTDTSAEAATHIAPRVQTLRDRALAVLQEKEGSADSVAEALGEESYNIRPRVTELFKLGLVEDSGKRQKNRHNRNCIVYRAVPIQSSLF